MFEIIKDREGGVSGVSIVGMIVSIALLGFMACAEIIAVYRFVLRWN